MEKAFYHIDVTDLAEQVSVPTLVLHARNDACIPFEEGRLLAAIIPDAKFIPLESKNHILLEGESAWDRFLAETRSFIGSSKAQKVAENPQEPFPELTPREGEVLDLIAKGLKNDEIADRLFISPKTVRNHNTQIFSKLRVESRSKAIVLAREAGLGKA